MKKLIVGNWKLHPTTTRDAEKLFRVAAHGSKSKKVQVVVALPFPYLSLVSRHKSHVILGAQDVFWEEKGPYTGEVSPVMLRDLGVRYVIIGHSERRHWIKETDEMIAKKVRAALWAGLRVILCVGESAPVRRRGLRVAERFVKNQLLKDLGLISRKSPVLHRLVVAYEPIWAIGTGKADKPKETLEMMRRIREFLRVTCHVSRVTILYGGSVNSKNVGSFVHYKDIDGALVGGASIKPEEWKKLVKNVSRHSS